MASRVPGSISKPQLGAKRTARSIRRGSSRKRSSASPTARIVRRRRSSWPPEGVDQVPPADLLGHGVDGEVPPRQVVLEGRPEGDLRLAGAVRVLLAAEGGDLDVGPFLPLPVRPAGLRAAGSRKMAPTVPKRAPTS